MKFLLALAKCTLRCGRASAHESKDGRAIVYAQLAGRLAALRIIL